MAGLLFSLHLITTIVPIAMPTKLAEYASLPQSSLGFAMSLGLLLQY